MYKLLSRLSLACIVALTLSGLAVAHEHDNRVPHTASQYGYQNGYSDGYQHGREDFHAQAGYDLGSRDYDDAMRGFEPYMGDHDNYQRGYREGYIAGYNDGFHGRNSRLMAFSAEPPYGNDRDDYRSQPRNGPQSVAFHVGYEDGLIAGGKDRRKGKHFRPSKHERYEHAGHGYNHNYGPKKQYKREYREGFLAGYQRGYGDFPGSYNR